jgi:hypothetical protein
MDDSIAEIRSQAQLAASPMTKGWWIARRDVELTLPAELLEPVADDLRELARLLDEREVAALGQLHMSSPRNPVRAH